MLNTAPTLVEFVIVAIIFVVMFGVSYLGVLVVTIWLYLYFTIKASNWRISIRRDMNESDTDANSKAIDSLLNFETVKYFANEEMEARRFDKSMEKLRALGDPHLDLARLPQLRPGGDLLRRRHRHRRPRRAGRAGGIADASATSCCSTRS